MSGAEVLGSGVFGSGTVVAFDPSAVDSLVVAGTDVTGAAPDPSAPPATPMVSPLSGTAWISAVFAGVSGWSS
ncbi:hypothetical protein HC762_00835 [bacterium]|nr:hypothetical protein [bacterium]